MYINVHTSLETAANEYSHLYFIYIAIISISIQSTII